jgi:hypothetical protein
MTTFIVGFLLKAKDLYVKFKLSVLTVVKRRVSEYSTVNFKQVRLNVFVWSYGIFIG